MKYILCFYISLLFLNLWTQVNALDIEIQTDKQQNTWYEEKIEGIFNVNISSPIYTYSWKEWSYGSCSVSCWWWIQYRIIICQRNDGNYVSDSYCNASLKNNTYRSCNTHDCSFSDPINGVCWSGKWVCTWWSRQWILNTSLCWTTATWKCNGSNGGNNSGTCSSYNWVCPTPVNGVCWSSKWSCSSWSASPVFNSNTCGQNAIWTCYGANGWRNASCSYVNPVCMTYSWYTSGWKDDVGNPLPWATACLNYRTVYCQNDQTRNKVNDSFCSGSKPSSFVKRCWSGS